MAEQCAQCRKPADFISLWRGACRHCGEAPLQSSRESYRVGALVIALDLAVLISQFHAHWWEPALIAACGAWLILYAMPRLRRTPRRPAREPYTLLHLR